MKTTEQKLKEARKEIRQLRLEARNLRIEASTLRGYRDICLEFFDSLTNCVKDGTTPTVYYWLKQMRRFFK